MTIRIVMMTLLIRKDALESDYPGGVEGFLRTHPGCPQDDDLVGFVAMSSDDIQAVVDALIAAGVDVKRGCAIADFLGGPFVVPEGFRLRRIDPERVFSGWEASLER